MWCRLFDQCWPESHAQLEGLTDPGGDFYKAPCTTDHPPQRGGWTRTACDGGAETSTTTVAYHGQSRNDGLNLSSPALLTTGAPSENGGSPACSNCANPIKFDGVRVDAAESNSKDGCLKDPIALDVTPISGALLARLMVRSEWTGADIKAELKHSLDRWAVVAKLVSGSLIMEDTTSVSDLGLTNGCLLQAIVYQCDIIVEGAGANKVNGCYVKTDRELESCPVYINDQGIILFKYRMSAGVLFWYFSEDGDLMKSDGDYYRVEGNQPHPPDAGWNHRLCPLGRGTTLPTIIFKSETVV